MGALEAIDGWPVGTAAAAVVGPNGVLEQRGDPAWTMRIASITKLLVAYAALIAVEEETLDLEQAAGPPGSTVRHLLAHASGLPFEGTVPVTEPGRRRIYSNTGFEALGVALEQAAGIDLAIYLADAVTEPLGMARTRLRGSPAHMAWSCVDDLIRFASELLAPSLVAAETFAGAVSPQWPELAGVVPGLGSFRPNWWGLGFELHGDKHPHWMPPEASEHAFGHFGGSGTFLWVEPNVRVTCVCLTDREFGPWSLEHWPTLGSRVLQEHAG